MLEQAVAIAREIDNRIDEMRSLANLAQTYLHRGELLRAEEIVHEALALARTSDSPFELAWLHFELGRSAFAAGELARSSS